MTTWLITGGAGYIGAHVARALQDSGRGVVILDDFSSGLERKVPSTTPVVRASVADRETVADAFGSIGSTEWCTLRRRRPPASQ